LLLHAALQRARLELAFACANPSSSSSGGASGGGSARLLLAYLPPTFSPALRLDSPLAAENEAAAAAPAAGSVRRRVRPGVDGAALRDAAPAADAPPADGALDGGGGGGEDPLAWCGPGAAPNLRAATAAFARAAAAAVEAARARARLEALTAPPPPAAPT
jgi:hypothetical protein